MDHSVGTYRICCIISFVPQSIFHFSDLVHVHANTRSTLHFGDSFESNEHPVEILNGTSTLIPCMAKGGSPMPSIFKATLYFDNGTKCRDLEEITNLTENSVDEDNSTQILTKHFLLIPYLNDHGKHVECEIIQGDHMFHEKDSRKIAVVFPPKDHPQHVAIKHPVSIFVNKIYRGKIL